MPDYTPTTEWLRVGWIRIRALDGVLQPVADAEFDRWLSTVTAGRDAALAQVERVKALHYAETRWARRRVAVVCNADSFMWPCPTIAALTEPTEEGDQ